MDTIKRNYGVPEQVFYSVALAAWNLCQQYLIKFTAFKPQYTAIYVANQLEAVQAAKNMPGSTQTLAQQKVARISLQDATKLVLYNWQMLKIYTTNAFPKNMLKAKLIEAGASLYIKCSGDNWQSVNGLILDANKFIQDNFDALTANENMPADFQARFADDAAACEAKAVIFANASMSREAATGLKIEANNAIYATLIEMLKSGRQIFKDDNIVKKQFTYSYLVSLYQGEGSASLKGYIVNDLNIPVEGVTIMSADGKYKAVTNKKGYYRITRITEGVHVFNATCPGYAPVEQQITFAAGTASKANFEMINQMKKVA